MVFGKGIGRRGQRSEQCALEVTGFYWGKISWGAGKNGRGKSVSYEETQKGRTIRDMVSTEKIFMEKKKTGEARNRGKAVHVSDTERGRLKGAVPLAS